MATISPFSELSSTGSVALEETGQAIYRRPSPLLNSPALTFGVSTKTAEPMRPSTPQLTPPKKVRFQETAIINVFDEIHSSGDSLVRSFTHSLKDGAARLRQMSQENIEKLKEAAQRAQESGFWSVLQQIGECILSAITAILGISLVASGAGTVVGSVMIASSVLTLANFAMRKTGSWDYVARQLATSREDQYRLSQYLSSGTSLVAAVLGLGGAAATALWTTMNMTQKALSIAQASMAIYQGAATTGKGLSDARALWTQSDLTNIESKTALERICYEDSSQVMQMIQKLMRQMQESTEQVIDLAAAAYRNIRIQA